MAKIQITFKRAILGFFILIFSIAFGAVVGIVAGALATAPDLDDIEFDPSLTTYIYDRNGEVIAKLYKENRIPVSIDEIPDDLQKAVIAIEDDHFYEHHGINFLSIARAIYVDLKEGRKAQGASTITMQLARNAFLSLDKSFSRKIKEVIWTIQIERKFTKDEILERYLNEIYMGHGAYGVEAAAQTYFGKHVSDLTLAESALLAGIIQIPGVHSPYIDMDAAYRRRAVVLNRMLELNMITREEYEQARAEEIKLAGLKPRETKAPYFVDYILKDLLAKYGEEQVYAGGLKVYTTLDLEMQEKAEKALLSNLPKKEVEGSDILQPQGAIVSIDPRTGEIKAMVGGRGNDKFNRAVQAKRQPGSAMKPFIYTAAIDRGFTPATIIEDAPVEYHLPNGEVWKPTNYDKEFHGPMTLREAVEDSINVVAVKVLDQVGVRTVVEYAKKMGITTLVEHGAKNDLNLALALGGLTQGVTPLEMASAYGVLANQGIYVEPIAILRVEDSEGHVLEERTPKRRIVLSEATAYVVTDMLRGVIERGTGKAANIGRPAAGKTGTTDDFTNAWFIGYTPDLVTAVYIGNDKQSEPLIFDGVKWGSWRAAYIWGQYMSSALAGTPIKNFERPDNVQNATICVDSGQLATEYCPEVRTEIFISGTEPKEYCTQHGFQPSQIWDFFFGSSNKQEETQEPEPPAEGPQTGEGSPQEAPSPKFWLFGN
ncbi:MAG: penicillin-binding protein 1A [Firmicutes bacterium]|nr:penicillin-binding protein 1A [Bacillota bacterium]